ncbi:hypothetical protein GGR57DRAFT_504815 [Xylariaceae sp. FL1272]|nr:hypothetical protein GGR57DRAFT_504815 [Xylariaceae sp. FL1272]
MRLQSMFLTFASAWFVVADPTSVGTMLGTGIIIPIPTTVPVITDSITATATTTATSTASAVCATICATTTNSQTCSCGCACYPPPTTSAAPPRLTPSWSRFILFGSLALVIYLITPVSSALAVNWVSTVESRMQCGDAQNVGSLPTEFLAKADDCKKIADSMNVNHGYYRTYDWNDNRANEFVIIDGEGTCEFTLRHVNKNSDVDVMVGNEDITDFIDLALKRTDGNGMVNAGGLFGCTKAKDQDNISDI